MNYIAHTTAMTLLPCHMRIKIRWVEASRVPHDATPIITDEVVARLMSESLGTEVPVIAPEVAGFGPGDVIYIFRPVRRQWRKVEIVGIEEAVATCNSLTPYLVDAITMYIASTEDPDAITDGLEAALLAGGMSYDDIARAVERFLPIGRRAV